MRAMSSLAAENLSRIGHVDDHMALRLGVAGIIRSHPRMSLVAAAATVPELLSQDSEFDVVVLDLRLSDGSRPATNIAQLRAAGARVLCYTSGDSAELIREAARAGVSGIVSKTEDPRHLLAAIVTVLRGDVVAGSEWASAIDADTQLAAAGLTPRESEVLAMYASGRAAEDVARQLDITRQTVVDHVRNIRAKYARVGRDAPTKVHLYQRAAEDGLLGE